MQKSQEAESGGLISLRLLLGEDPEHLSQQLQAISLQDREPPGSPSLSKVGSEYLPFCTFEQPLAMKELALLAEVGPGHEAGWSSRGGLFLKDLAPPSGFFPYYRSQEEHLARATIPQGCSWCLGSRDPFPGSETQDGCSKVTARDGCLVSSKRSQEGRSALDSGMLQTPIPDLYPSETLARSLMAQ